jgi:hypothetical protein
MITCADCAFFDPKHDDPTMGWCHRHAPQTLSNGYNWACVQAEDWCGDAEPTVEPGQGTFVRAGRRR